MSPSPMSLLSALYNFCLLHSLLFRVLSFGLHTRIGRRKRESFGHAWVEPWREWTNNERDYNWGWHLFWKQTTEARQGCRLASRLLQKGSLCATFYKIGRPTSGPGILWSWMDLIANGILYIARPAGAPWIGNHGVGKAVKNKCLYSLLSRPLGTLRACSTSLARLMNPDGLLLPSRTAHQA